ncbi:AAA family ATPase [Flavobacteriaceae bacterium S356]|uniref:AAA family ATPase n=1 Tax=Asprobacillus argus TaxID=3076534 RepID=A0ABU3LF07_9FLAO|nr:AAA family ATPase [Flavobacteriaceae bacterium S356]
MDKDYLKSVGKVWTQKGLTSDIITTDQLQEHIDSICSLLTKPNPRSILVTGDKGVGKSTMIQAVAKKLSSEKWFIFSATAANLMAGQRYIGDLELSVQRVVTELTSKKKVLWIVPRFHELYYGGRHEFSPVSILDHLLPYLERGELKMVSEADPLSLEKITQKRPQVLSVFETVRLENLDQQNTLKLAQGWIDVQNNAIWSSFKTKSLLETYALANQYLSFKENPGQMIDLLKQTQIFVEADQKNLRTIGIGDVYGTISNITGLPSTILDDKEKLDLDHVKEHFANKVIGQKDAVDTIIERIAMIKAGLTDPNKPAGVFLFVGPTGTGKTEIAKAFAEYLFGSPERLIRLDMSEFQTYESSFKIFGDASDTSENSALVNVIRRKPFSVVLLDEFEKAHPNIWDIFLQVFDDGRLTDQKGALANFRHSIIILTSNIGASVPSSKNVGYKALINDDLDIDSNVSKSIHQTFRPEFINRLDKIVVFNPLTKSVAKTILKKELKKVLERRGLRQREWELDFEESAIEFLLEKGFSSAFGARPLKRAIEKYLLAPLAITIVNHNFPNGNQFLLVSASKDKLKVQFIDPDEPDYDWEQKKEILKKEGSRSENLELTNILILCKGLLSEFKVIQRELEALQLLISQEELSSKKDRLLSEMSKNEFWSRPDRYEILAEIEYLDRFDSVLESVNKLFERLHNPEKERLSYDAKLIKKLTQKVYLLKNSLGSYIANETQDAVLCVRYDKEHTAIGKKIENMYVTWAKSRGMYMNKLHEHGDNNEKESMYTFSGFAAYKLLTPESGYHVFEEIREGKKTPVKTKIKVQVVPMELDDHRSEDHDKIMTKLDNETNLSIIRRYKLGKSPVVKDLVKGWQTGKLDQVLSGDFDLF